MGLTVNIDGIYMTANFRKTRNGFAHDATAILENGTRIEHSVHYLNRTWERYDYQTALHELCRHIAVRKFGAPSVRSLLTAKKYEVARQYAEQLAEQVDLKRCA